MEELVEWNSRSADRRVVSGSGNMEDYRCAGRGCAAGSNESATELEPGGGAAAGDRRNIFRGANSRTEISPLGILADGVSAGGLHDLYRRQLQRIARSGVPVFSMAEARRGSWILCGRWRHAASGCAGWALVEAQREPARRRAGVGSGGGVRAAVL